MDGWGGSCLVRVWFALVPHWFAFGSPWVHFLSALRLVPCWFALSCHGFPSVRLDSLLIHLTLFWLVRVWSI